MEVLFVIAVILAAYTAYSILDKGGDTKKSAPVATQKPAPAQTKEAKAEPVTAETKSAPKAEKIEEAKPSAAVEASAAEQAAAVTSLRDPKTGEVSAVPANYRFAKRWIKDALVAEGLLDKVYKNSELDDANAAKVKNALEALKSLQKYQA